MGSRLPTILLALGLSVAVWQPAAAGSYGELKRIVDKAVERLQEFERRIRERSDSAQEVVVRIIRKGFEFFAQSSTVTKVGKLPAAFYDRFVELTLTRFRVPQQDRDEIKAKVFDVLRDSAEPGKWLVHKLLYNPQDDPDSTKYLSVLGHVQPDGSFDIVTLEVLAKFRLARNLLIIQNKDTGDLSVETEEIETERLPEGEVEKSDVQLLLNFFEAIGLRALQRQL